MVIQKEFEITGPKESQTFLSLVSKLTIRPPGLIGAGFHTCHLHIKKQRKKITI